MQFRVERGITPGGIHVTVSTDYPAPCDEIAGIAMGAMAGEFAEVPQVSRDPHARDGLCGGV